MALIEQGFGAASDLTAQDTSADLSVNPFRVRTIVSPTKGTLNILSIAVGAVKSDLTVVDGIIRVQAFKGKGTSTFSPSIYNNPAAAGYSVAFSGLVRLTTGAQFQFLPGELSCSDGEVIFVVVGPAFDATATEISVVSSLAVTGVDSTPAVDVKLR